MTKFRVLFLVSLMTAISGCDQGNHSNSEWCADVRCLENIKKSAFPCVNDQDIKARLNEIHEEMHNKHCFTCADYQRLYCREMLDGLKK